MTNKEAFRILLAIENKVPLTDKQVLAIDIAIKALVQGSCESYMKFGGWWVADNNENYSPFDGSGENVYRCSVCYKKESRATKYCPNCGCFMFTREPEVFNNDK